MASLTDYTVIDLETTGLNPCRDELTEVAAVRVRGGKVVDQFQSLINPGCEIPPFVAAKTHITNEMVASAASSAEVLPQFLDFIGKDLLVGYNIDRFDLDFIRTKVRCALGIHFRADTFDVWEFARRKLRGRVPSLKLDALRQELGICCEGAHRALKDCLDTHEIYMKLVDLPDVPARDFWQERCASSERQLREEMRMLEELEARSKELKAKIPAKFKPVMKDYIPLKYKDRWAFVKDHPFKTFASTIVSVTGGSERAPRDAVEAILPRLGSIVKHSTTRDCDFCIALSEEAVTKLSAARSLQLQGSPIRIINDVEFLEMFETSLNEVSDPEAERQAIAYVESRAADELRAKEAAQVAKRQATEARKNVRAEARKAREKELENYDGPRRKRSSKALSVWRDEFTQLWNEILADDVIEPGELTMMKTWLNLHKRRRDDYLEMLRLIDELAEVGSVDGDAMQRLYEGAEQVLKCLTPDDDPAPVKVEYESPEVAALAEEYGSLFHPMHPFLDATYTPSVRMPAFDLTDAVSEFHEKGNDSALRELWKYVGGGTMDAVLGAALPSGIEISAFAQNEMWAINALTLRMSERQGAKMALDAGSRMLATTFSVREATFDEKWANLLPETCSRIGLSECGAIPGVLKGLSPSLRCVFYLSGLGAVDENGARIMPYALDYEGRCYGSSAKVNRMLAESLNILEVFLPGVTGVPGTLNRAALMEILKQNGIEYAHGEKRESLIEKLIKLPDVFRETINRYAPEMKVVSDRHEQALAMWARRTQQLIPLAKAVLSQMSGL